MKSSPNLPGLAKKDRFCPPGWKKQLVRLGTLCLPDLQNKVQPVSRWIWSGAYQPHHRTAQTSGRGTQPVLLNRRTIW